MLVGLSLVNNLLLMFLDDKLGLSAPHQWVSLALIRHETAQTTLVLVNVIIVVSVDSKKSLFIFINFLFVFALFVFEILAKSF